MVIKTNEFQLVLHSTRSSRELQLSNKQPKSQSSLDLLKQNIQNQNTAEFQPPNCIAKWSEGGREVICVKTLQLFHSDYWTEYNIQELDTSVLTRCSPGSLETEPLPFFTSTIQVASFPPGPFFTLKANTPPIFLTSCSPSCREWRRISVPRNSAGQIMVVGWEQLPAHFKLNTTVIHGYGNSVIWMI